MDEYNAYMKKKNLIRYRYVVNKHNSFLSQLGTCETSQILDLDRKFSDKKTTLRSIIMDIKDKKDGQKVFHSVDPSWRTNTDFIITYRPDKQDLAYEFRNSLSTYVSFLFPDENLARIFTYEALVTASEESYDLESQSFITRNDYELDLQFQDALSENTHRWVSMETDENLEKELMKYRQPQAIIGNLRHFNLSGEADTVSTVSTLADSSSITFDDNVQVTHYEDEKTETNNTDDSTKREIDKMKESNRATQESIGELKESMTQIMKYFKNKTDMADHQEDGSATQE